MAGSENGESSSELSGFSLIFSDHKKVPQVLGISTISYLDINKTIWPNSPFNMHLIPVFRRFIQAAQTSFKVC